MNDQNAEMVKKLTETLEAGVSEDAMKGLRKNVDSMLESIESDIMYRLKDELAGNLAAYVNEMAENTVRQLLNGNEDQMRYYLGCKQGYWTGRSESPQHGRQREIHEWHSVIHGKLFEQGAVAIRKGIVEAHRKLLVNERILDLEDQVKSLVAQVNKANAEKDSMWERLRAAA